jgi:hypothetical protein
VAYLDVFNGDADGICALQQLRLAQPVPSTLVSGVKRDIALLDRVQASAGDEITVLDISLDKNRAALLRLLELGAAVVYFDHHFAGDIPTHLRLAATIDTAPDTCTSLLVDRNLGGRFRVWAVVGAFGDNLDASAKAAAEPLGLEEAQLSRLRELGIYLNYNAYGAGIEDLYFPPDELFRRIQPYTDPFSFIDQDQAFATLRDGYAADIAKTQALQPQRVSAGYALYVLPAQAWARRVSGVLANRLAQQHPDRAHALLTRLPGGGYVVSVRAPLSNKTGADALCRQFPTGGGRQAAAGINLLAEDSFETFAERFAQAYA